MRISQLKIAATELVRCHALYIKEYRNDPHILDCRPPLRIEVTAKGVRSYEELFSRYCLDHTVVIGANDCENTPYGVHGNLTIRAAHDLGHCIHRCDFSLTDEAYLLEIMEPAILKFCVPQFLDAVRNLYWVDGLAYQLYHKMHGKFPLNQNDFTSQVLETFK